ncbi:hypothetical protein E2C01_077562 [Portunus trituberculatus]|uniref:Uncharacterized protein n=1 Tax=Portunus trituberculatus TaxID=210409 RepID=A0A5B7IMN0_PORTR|nr:hypothetical protein [Portunus trituberculatus]
MCRTNPGHDIMEASYAHDTSNINKLALGKCTRLQFGWLQIFRNGSFKMPFATFLAPVILGLAGILACNQLDSAVGGTMLETE